MIQEDEAARKEFWDKIVENHESKIAKTVSEILPHLELFEKAVEDNDRESLNRCYKSIAAIQPQTKEEAIILSEVFGMIANKIITIKGEV